MNQPSQPNEEVQPPLALWPETPYPGSGKNPGHLPFVLP